MKKIIFSDMDGTLINKQQKELHEGNFEAIKKWRQAGNLFVLCTGRNAIDIVPTLNMCDIEYDYMVLCNGALILDKDKNVIFEREFPYELGKDILMSAHQYPDITTFYCDQNELVMARNDEMMIIDSQGNKKEVDKNQTFESYVKKATCFKMLCVFEDGAVEKLIEIQDQLLLPHQHEISWFFNKDCIDMMGYDVSKGKGMMQLSEILGMDKQQIYAIGDSFNDLSMIDMAGHGCTFEDCPRVLKEHANHIVDSVGDLIGKVLSEKL